VFLAVLAMLGSFSFVKNLDDKSIDILRISHEPHADVIILAIDNKSLREIGRWPWGRNIHASILNKLNDYKPRIVGYDVNFAEPENVDNDKMFSESINRIDFPLVFPVEPIYIKGEDGPSRALLPLAYFLDGENIGLGSVDVTTDDSGLARSFPRFFSIEGEKFMPFSFRIAELLGVFTPSNHLNYEVNFSGSAGSFPTYSLSDFLKDQISYDQLSNKIILIGATASDLHDTVMTPIKGSLMSGVEWHANVLDNLLLGRSLVTIPRIAFVSFSIFLAVMFLLIFAHVGTRNSVLATIFGLITVFIGSFLGMGFDIAVPYFFAWIVILSSFIFNAFLKWYLAELEKRKLKNSIQHYFSPQVVQSILSSPDRLKLGGERREVTILFSDIRSFTTITENTPPEILSRMLHEYFTEMTEEILATDGVLDKFIGDAIMAFWGAPLDQPNHADRAVKTAVGMMKRLRKLQERFENEGLPRVDIGIGVNTGIVTVGNMGSKKRFDYTVIGDSVNVASRLESLNKEYNKTHVIISESTKEKLKENFDYRELDSVTVKGKTIPIKIFEVLV
jgi:adenylate cyclase